jgi:hypothetical protein
MDRYKYHKYKAKYQALVNLIGGSERFRCMIERDGEYQHDAKYHEICQRDDSGNFENKDECMEECKDPYLDMQMKYPQLQESNETDNWIRTINFLIDQGYSVYLKGGSVIGLFVLQFMHESGALNDDTFQAFLELDLIKDWDFTTYIPDTEQDRIMEQLDDWNISLEGTTIKVVRHQPKIMVSDEDPQYEMSIKANDPVSELEIPLTAMKGKFTKGNIRLILTFAKHFFAYKTEEDDIDLSMIKGLISEIPLIVPESEDGLFLVGSEADFDDGGFSPDLLDVIDQMTDNLNEKQLLVCQIKQPDRLFNRLLSKNIKKSNKIFEFLLSLDVDIQGIQWLLNETRLSEIAHEFLSHLSNKLKTELDDVDGLPEKLERYDSYSDLFNQIERFNGIHTYVEHAEKLQTLINKATNDKARANFNNNLEKHRSLFSADPQERLDEHNELAGSIVDSAKTLNIAIDPSSDDPSSNDLDRLYSALNSKKFRKKFNYQKVENEYIQELYSAIYDIENRIFRNVNFARLAGVISTSVSEEGKILIRSMFSKIGEPYRLFELIDKLFRHYTKQPKTGTKANLIAILKQV